MADEQKAGEMPEPQDTAPAAPTSETPDALKAELEQARAALKLANREAADRRKKLEAYEAAEKQKADAEMTEAQKLKAQLEETASELKAMKSNELKRKAAAKYSLPDALALRLQGNTEEELDADAKALAETLPKPAPKQPGPQPANPGAAGKAEETIEQKKARLFGEGLDIFSPEIQKRMGGGYTLPNE